MKTAIRFFLFFIGVMGFLVILHKMGFKSVPPQTWPEIYEDLPFIIIFSLITAVIFTIIAHFESGKGDKKE